MQTIKAIWNGYKDFLAELTDPSCYWCRKLDIEGVLNGESYQLHYNFANLRHCAPTCSLCHDAYKSMRNQVPIDWQEGDSTRGPWYEENDDVQARYAVIVIYDRNDPFSNPGINIQELCIVICDGESFLSAPRRWMDVWTFHGDPAVEAGIPWFRCIPANTASKSTLEVARKWLEDCISGKCSIWHGEGAISGAIDDGRRPGRMIEIDSTDRSRLTLIDGIGCRYAYAALSYSWGSTLPTWQTTTRNVATRNRGFSLKDLPKTLVDAVVIAWELGLRYLWIDAVCIIQDSKEDWNKEAAKMSYVYTNAFVTIAADSSAGSLAGIFNKRSIGHYENRHWHPTIITGNRTDGRQTTLYLSQESPPDEWGGFVEHDVRSTRAWCFQENILSPRILHFTDMQLFWECLHCVRSEDNYINTPRRPGNSGMDSLKRVLLDHGYGSRDRTRLSHDAVKHSWYKSVVSSDYCHRQLSHPSDKLVALAGVAEAMKATFDLRYHAGLWEETMPEALCWQRLGKGWKASEYRAPSWSWASQDSEVSWYIFTGPRDYIPTKSYAEVQKIHLEGQQGCGSVSGGYISLAAPAVQGKCLPMAEETYNYIRRLELRFGESFMATLDDHRVTDIEVVACLVAEAPDPQDVTNLYVLLLQQERADSDTYFRVGQAKRAFTEWASVGADVIRVFGTRQTFKIV